MGVAPGSPVTAANSNQAWLDANADDTAVGIIGLSNTNAVSGQPISNIQREHNATGSFTGMPLNSAKDVLPGWNNNDVGASSDDLKTRADQLTAKFNPSSGHKHTGASGDAPQVSSVDLAAVVLHGYFTQGVTKTSITGSSMDVSSDFSTQTPSNDQFTKGVVVNFPYNDIPLYQGSGVNQGDSWLDGSGNTVYGRLTFSSGVWTISFFSLVSGTETSYSFASSSDIAYQYQALYSPIVDAPVYSEFRSMQSENVAVDVPFASETLAGKVLLSNIVAAPVGSANVKGTGTRVSHEDHAHEGVHSLGIDGLLTQLLGDTQLKAGTGITLSFDSGKIKIDSSGGTVGYQEAPSNPVNGVNATFGPLSQTAADANSLLVIVDGIIRPKTEWSFASNTVTFGASFIPQTGQDVYIFYLINGTPAPPPVVTGALKTEFRTITSGEITAKKIILVQTPASPGDVLVDMIGGTGQIFNVDYTIVSNELRWNGYALDGLIAQNDVLRVHYIY